MRREKVDNVFTPRSAKVNKKMYINRDNLENELIRKIRGTHHIIIHGESGCGKSWLYKSVLTDKKIYYKVVNLAFADTYKSISKILEIETATGEAEKEGFTEKKSAGLDVVVASSEIDHVNQFTIRRKESLYLFLDKYFKKNGGFICFENLETIFDSPSLMKELGNLIILLDDEKFSEYRTRFIIAGVPSHILNYYSNIKNLATVANRTTEVPEVTGMNKVQVYELLERGFIEKLKVHFNSQDEKNALFNHITFITNGIPQNVHEYSCIIAYLVEDNNWHFDLKFIDEADTLWLKDSLYKNYQVIQEIMNSENTEIGRRNQVLYCIGKIESKSFTLTEIEELLKREFPKTSNKKSLNLSIPLGDIMENKVTFIKKQNKVFYITDRRFLLCIRTMLRKTADERITRIDLGML